MGVRCGRFSFAWALMGHIGVGYMFKMLKFYFAIILLYTGSVKKKCTRDQSIRARAGRRTDRWMFKGIEQTRFGWLAECTDGPHAQTQRCRDVDMCCGRKSQLKQATNIWLPLFVEVGGAGTIKQKNLCFFVASKTWREVLLGVKLATFFNTPPMCFLV